jgi:hypothetical protein
MYIAPKITQPGYYTTEPAPMIMKILDSTALMYFIPFLTIGIIVAIAYGVIKLHHLPKYHWSKMYKTDIGLINILSILGWFYHSLWVVAVILAFINWKVLESIVIGVIQKALGIIPNLPQPQISQEENTDNYDNILENKNSNNLNTFKDNEITFIKDNNKK